MQLSLSNLKGFECKQARAGSRQRMHCSCTAASRSSAVAPPQPDRSSELSTKFAAALSAIVLTSSVVSPVAIAQESKLAEQVATAVEKSSNTQTGGLASTIINGCTSGWTSDLCKSALTRASALCKGQGNKDNCVGLFIDLCQKNKTVCKQASGPLCEAAGSYSGQCKLAVKAVTSPVGGLAAKILGGR